MDDRISKAHSPRMPFLEHLFLQTFFIMTTKASRLQNLYGADLVTLLLLFLICQMHCQTQRLTINYANPSII